MRARDKQSYPCRKHLKNKRENIRMSARHGVQPARKRSRQAIRSRFATLPSRCINRGNQWEDERRLSARLRAETKKSSFILSRNLQSMTQRHLPLLHILVNKENLISLSFSAQSVNAMQACTNDALFLLRNETSSGSQWFSHSLSFSDGTSFLDRSSSPLPFCVTGEQSFVHLEETSISNNEFRTARTRK